MHFRPSFHNRWPFFCFLVFVLFFTSLRICTIEAPLQVRSISSAKVSKGRQGSAMEKRERLSEETQKKDKRTDKNRSPSSYLGVQTLFGCFYYEGHSGGLGGFCQTVETGPDEKLKEIKKETREREIRGLGKKK